MACFSPHDILPDRPGSEPTKRQRPAGATAATARPVGALHYPQGAGRGRCDGGAVNNTKIAMNRASRSGTCIELPVDVEGGLCAPISQQPLADDVITMADIHGAYSHHAAAPSGGEPTGGERLMAIHPSRSNVPRCRLRARCRPQAHRAPRRCLHARDEARRDGDGPRDGGLRSVSLRSVNLLTQQFRCARARSDRPPLGLSLLQVPRARQQVHPRVREHELPAEAAAGRERRRRILHDRHGGGEPRREALPSFRCSTPALWRLRARPRFPSQRPAPCALSVLQRLMEKGRQHADADHARREAADAALRAAKGGQLR